MLQPVLRVKMSSDVHERLAELHIPYPPGPKRLRRMKQVRRAGVLFIHIPKNAGTSLTRALYDMDVGHETIRYFNRRMPQLAGLPSFAILRDPVQRFLSAYRYARAGGSALRSVSRGFRSTYMNFGGVDEALDHIARALLPYEVDHIFRPQAWYVTDRHGQQAVNHLFMLDDMMGIEAFVRRYTPNPVGHINGGTKADDITTLRLDQIARLRQIYHMDYALIASCMAGSATPLPSRA
ncbi:sulfotransferase family 2 domain-containing protein [Komagataeibacter sp. FNDCF1]|uniref:sulfotransferase family 2 domain-containing protein n=1 Tax=Komagataeibacter sp. FNDCF1 TaxID=2878681 RepID=UPI001E2D29ED|nr:sulfotransferase family 2 domain-containing protein [Komagataeibacter sp. FNDCF1]MCE2563683.1 sulfotransferase family protein [Komagataeibacter sp. FNDCF1]